MANALTKIKTNALADDAVTSAKIADDAVVSAAVADDAITSALIADDAVTSALIADDAITSALIADDAVVAAGIADDAVVQAAIADEAVNEARLQVSNSPTNGYALTAQSGNTGGLTWAEVGGTWVKLAQTTGGTAVNDITFDSLDTSTYRAFKFIGGMQPETDDVQLRFRFRVGGSDLSTSKYDWSYMVAYPDDGHLAQGLNDQDYIKLFGDGGNQSREGWTFELLLFPHVDGHASQIGNIITWQGMRQDDGHLFRCINGAAHYDVDDQYVNGFKLYPSSGRFDYHNHTLYGIKA